MSVGFNYLLYVRGQTYLMFKCNYIFKMKGQWFMKKMLSGCLLVNFMFNCLG